MIRDSVRPLLAGTACILFAIAVTGSQIFIGSLIGYWVGFVYTLWFHRETLRISELDIRTAHRRMFKNLMERLGMITLVVVAVARFQESWLFSLALGIVAGVFISFTVAILKKKERGDK